MINLWRIITRALTARPTKSEDLAFQGDTGNGSPADAGYQWIEKEYDLAVRSGPDGVLSLAVGIWGTWEGARTYYLDSIRVTISEP